MSGSIDKKDWLKKILLLFILIQPLLDTYFLYSEKLLDSLRFSPSTIIRFVFLIMICLFMLIKCKFSKPTIYSIIIYLFIVFIYFIFHHLSAVQFQLKNLNLDYGLFKEFFYLCRLVYPIILALVCYNVSITIPTMLKTITILSLFMSSLIIISNLFVISLDSYTNLKISGNIFSWFTDGYEKFGFNGLASKGYFYFANQIAAIFAMLYPLVFLAVIKRKNIENIVALIIQPIAMIMLGTKVSTYSFILIVTVCLIVYIIVSLVQKNKLKLYVFLIASIVLLEAIVIIPHSPAYYRQNIHNNTVVEKNSQTMHPPTDDPNSSNPFDITKIHTSAEKIAFIKANYELSGINPMFILKSYPYSSDPDFWFEILQLPAELRLDNRYIEESMIKRAKELGGGSLTTLFGMSYEKMCSIYNIEQDIVSQYHSMGILGVLLFFGPLILLLCYAAITIIMHIKQKLTYANMFIGMSIALAFCIGFISGNTLDNMFTMIILGFLAGVYLKNLVSSNDPT